MKRNAPPRNWIINLSNNQIQAEFWNLNTRFKWGILILKCLQKTYPRVFEMYLFSSWLRALLKDLPKFQPFHTSVRFWGFEIDVRWCTFQSFWSWSLFISTLLPFTLRALISRRGALIQTEGWPLFWRLGALSCGSSTELQIRATTHGGNTSALHLNHFDSH